MCQSHYCTPRTDWGLRCLRVHCFSCDMAGSVISLWSTPPTTAWVFKTEFLLPWRHGLYMQWIEERWKHMICSDLVMLWYALYRLETSWTFTLYRDQNKIIHFELANHNSPGAVAAVELMVQAHSGAYHSQGRVDSGVEDIEGSIAQNTWSGMHNMWKKLLDALSRSTKYNPKKGWNTRFHGWNLTSNEKCTALQGSILCNVGIFSTPWFDIVSTSWWTWWLLFHMFSNLIGQTWSNHCREFFRLGCRHALSAV